MRVLESLPRFAAIAALVVWGFTLPLLAALGHPLTDFSTFAFLAVTGVATLLILLAQKPNLRAVNLLLWVSAGLWTGASYLNQEILGFLYLLMALLTAGSAVVRERGQGGFSLTGPVAFIAALVLMIVVFQALHL